MGHLTKIANDLYKNMDKGKNQEKLTSLYNGMFSVFKFVKFFKPVVSVQKEWCFIVAQGG